MGKEILLLLIMFWNLENFFDPFINNIPESVKDSTLAADYDYSPTGSKHWSWKRFSKKRDDIAKTITLVKEQQGVYPALIGVCEVENRFVLNQLTQNTILAPLDYGVIHKDSPDRRGIDAALLYRKSEFKPLKREFYPIITENTVGIKDSIKTVDDTLKTRLLVYVKGVFRELDTLHCLVAHWPSRLGGKAESDGRREAASYLLKSVTDSILRTDAGANIVVMGDFNAGAEDKSLKNLCNLVNMSLQGDKKHQKQYTYKYKGEWDRIDHFFVSRSFVQEKADFLKNAAVTRLKYLFCNDISSMVFKHPFLLEKDNTYLGYKIRRTMIGPRYNGGVSDHLPILLKVYGYDF